MAQKALRVNLSDLAAKGAVAEYYLLAITLPPTITMEWLKAFAAGLARHGYPAPRIRDRGHQTLLRTIIGQQVSVAGARTLTRRMVTSVGTPAELGEGLTHLFPTPEQVATTAPEDFAMPRSRGRALVGLARAVAGGEIDLGAPDVRTRLLALPGIGPWSVDHVAMRSLGDADVFLPTDIGVRRAAERLGTDLPGVVAASEAWRPWRSYALHHLWSSST